MNKKIKTTIALMLLTTTIASTNTIVFAEQTTPTKVTEISQENDNTSNFSILRNDSKNRIVTFSLNNDEYTYDVNNEILTLADGSYFKIETEVDYINPNSNLTKEEVLEMDKQLMYDNILSLENKEYRNTRSSRFDIPSNAAYVKETTVSKKLSEYVGEVGKALNSISIVTGGLSFLSGIPKANLLNAVSYATGLTGTAVSAAAGKVKGTWTYDLERTKSQYQHYASKQYGYRYAHSKINLNGTAKNKSFNTTPGYSKKGNWWTNAKPW